MEKQKAFKIYGKVRELESKIGVHSLKVEALDKDLIFDDRLGSVTTDIDGYFEIMYDKEVFQELFFDQRPDIYLRIKNPDGKLISTTEDKVRYGANRTEEFVINLPKKLLKRGKKMKEKIENSRELRDRILSDEKLLSDLSEKVAGILKGKVEIGEDETYTFVPLVNKKSAFAPEIFAGPRTEVGPWWWCRYWPVCGLPPVEFLKVIEKYRITEKTPRPGMTLREQILGNKALLHELSEVVSSALKVHGVAISEDVMYVFSPTVYKKPTFVHEMFMDVTPMVAAGPHPDPSSPVVVADPTPEPAIIAARHMASESASWRIVTPIDGIPAPELLYALEKHRFK